jgi:negative regulator of flagellin synthesis FlgM
LWFRDKFPKEDRPDAVNVFEPNQDHRHMSQKIDGGIAASAQLRPVTVLAKAAPAGDTAARPVEAVDSLRLTGEATNLQAMQRELSTAPAIDSGRVQAVREALENGSYRINPEAIAQRMLDMDQQLRG